MSASNEDFQPPPPPNPEVKPKKARPVKLLPVGIALLVIGLLVVGAGFAKVIAAGKSTGGAIAFVGLLLLLFSFIPLPVGKEPGEPLSFLDKVTGIFYEPARVFRNLRDYPHWAGAYVLIGLLTAVYSFCFIQRITPERMVEHTYQKMSEMQPPFRMPQEALDTMRTEQLQSLKSPVERIGAVVKAFVGILVVTCIIAALSLLGILAFGGRMNFWQALAVTFYAALPVIAIQKLLGLAILYLKSPDDLHPILNQETTLQDNLGILFTPADHPVLFVMASFIGLTALYGLWLRAKGLHNGGTRVGKSAGWGVAIALQLLFLILATTVTALFPQFIS